MTLFRGFFSTVHGFLFRASREIFGALPLPREGRAEKEANFHPRANFHREGPTPTPGRANPHFKKEWGPLKARRKGKKKGPTTTEEKKPAPRRKDQPPTPRRKDQLHHPKKEWPTSPPQREGKPQPKEGRAKTQPQERRVNHHSKKGGRTPTARRRRPPAP